MNTETEKKHASAQSDLTNEFAATVERDAARYRWLRNEALQDARVKPFGIAIGILDTQTNENGNYNIIGWAVQYEDDADAAIDAAMATMPPAPQLHQSAQPQQHARLQRASMISMMTSPSKIYAQSLTGVVIEALQYFDHIDKNGVPMTAAETTESISGGIKRYQTDPVFHAKVQMLVSRLITVIDEVLNA